MIFLVEPDSYGFVAEVLGKLHGTFEKMTPDKIRKLLNPAVATTIAVELQALAASLGEPYSYYLNRAVELEYAVKNQMDEIYLKERRRQDLKTSVDDALVVARQQTTVLRKQLEDNKSMAQRLKNILDRADKLSSALQSHAATLRAQGGS